MNIIDAATALKEGKMVIRRGYHYVALKMSKGTYGYIVREDGHPHSPLGVEDLLAEDWEIKR